LADAEELEEHLTPSGLAMLPLPLPLPLLLLQQGMEMHDRRDL
jgi:hypothetical protein